RSATWSSKSQSTRTPCTGRIRNSKPKGSSRVNPAAAPSSDDHCPDCPTTRGHWSVVWWPGSEPHVPVVFMTRPSKRSSPMRNDCQRERIHHDGCPGSRGPRASLSDYLGTARLHPFGSRRHGHGTG